MDTMKEKNKSFESEVYKLDMAKKMLAINVDMSVVKKNHWPVMERNPVPSNIELEN